MKDLIRVSIAIMVIALAAGAIAFIITTSSIWATVTSAKATCEDLAATGVKTDQSNVSVIQKGNSPKLEIMRRCKIVYNDDDETNVTTEGSIKLTVK